MNDIQKLSDLTPKEIDLLKFENEWDGNMLVNTRWEEYQRPSQLCGEWSDNFNHWSLSCSDLCQNQKITGALKKPTF